MLPAKGGKLTDTQIAENRNKEFSSAERLISRNHLLFAPNHAAQLDQRRCEFPVLQKAELVVDREVRG